LLNDPAISSIPIDEEYLFMEGIQILYDDNQWWGFVIGGNGQVNDEYFLRLNFGNALSNNPTIENLGGNGNLSYPHDLFIMEENGQWIGITISKFNDTITRFDFGDSLSNTPTATNLGNVGNISSPTGFYPIQVNYNWHLFITNSQTSSTLSRVNFGQSFSGSPFGINLGSFGILNRPRDVLITEICDEYFGLVLNRGTKEIILLEFGTDITSIPSARSLGNIGDLAFPHSISNLHLTDEGLVVFICNVDSESLVRILFEFPIGHIDECKADASNFNISYSEPGTYDLEILSNDNQGNQNTFCKEIVVLPLPLVDLGQDTILCKGESLVLNSDYTTTTWQDQTESNTFAVFETGEYIAEVSEQGCSSSDSIYVEFKNCISPLYFPNVFSPNGDGANDVYQVYFSNDLELLSFELEIYDRWGEVVFQTDDPLVGWDGRFKKKQTRDGVFVYKCDFSYREGGGEDVGSMTGDITLIR